MLKYIKGLYRLWRIRFDIQGCECIYYLWGTLNLFLQAEGKLMQGLGPEHDVWKRKVCSHPIAKRPVVSRLPQFSEALHERIQELRIMHDSKFSTKRIIKPRPEFPPPIPSLLSLEKDSFFRNNEALLLTYPGPIPEMDFQKSALQADWETN